MKKLSSVLLVLLVFGLLFQAGFSALANVTSPSEKTTEDEAEVQDIVIIEEVLNAIKSQAPEHYETNVSLYKNFLIHFNVTERYRSEVERLILKGVQLHQILIAYEFLYQNLGLVTELEALASSSSTADQWAAAFTAYLSNHEMFVPRAHDSDYLEFLMNSTELTTDDIMIADRISFISGKPFKDIVQLKLEDTQWKEIAEGEGILNNATELPRVQITVDQMKLYTQLGMSEEQVAEAFVIAEQAGTTPENVIEQLNLGVIEEEILAKSYLAKYKPY